MSYFKKNLIHLLTSVTIEPMTFLFYTAWSISSYAAGNILIQKGCYPDLTSEPDYNNPCPDEKAAQKLVSDIGIWKPFLEYPLIAICVIFLGAWSDTHGKRRRPLFLIPIVGDILTNSFLLFSAYYWNTSITLTAAISSVLHGLGGSGVCFAFGAFAYLSDITTLEERTVRFGIISAITFIGIPLGTVLGGVLRKEVGFFKLFALCLGVNIVTGLLGVLTVNNTATVESKLKPFEGLGDPSVFFTSIKTIFKKRCNNNRSIVIIMLILSSLFLCVYMGEPMYLFFRYKFNYDEVEYGYYSAYKSFTLFLGNIFSVYMCSRVFSMTDAAIGCLATVTQSIYVIAMCFLAQHRWQLYLFPIIDIMQGAVYTITRSIISKTVEVTELAQVLSVVGAADSVLPLTVYSLYNFIYNLTFVSMPGAFYLLSLILITIMFLFFVAVFFMQKRNKLKDVEGA